MKFATHISRPERTYSRPLSLILAVCLIAGTVARSSAQTGPSPAAQPPARPQQPAPRPTPCTDTVTTPDPFVDNGIAVGQTKVFDERSLRTMLEAAESSLQKISAIDAARVTQATGSLQGARERQRSLGVSATTLPGVIIGSENNPPEGKEIEPNVPAAPGQTSLIPFQPTFGISSQDLLAEQMSLTYQVVNLRMLLERSLTDRVIIEDLTPDEHGPRFSPSPRAQTIAGFQVSVDPRPGYRNAVAEVEVTVSSGCEHAQPASLVALLPRDKTYNVATLSKDSKSFGLGAVVQIFNVGVNASGSSETLFLVRDTDTVALERIPQPQAASGAPALAKSITFGWQFRPVLGRKAVEPGTRQVFAMLALPIENRFGLGYTGLVEVHTRWRRFDAKTNTVGEVISGSENTQRLEPLKVRAGSFDEFVLGPEVESVKWNNIGNDQVMVTVTGRNFLSGTSVVVGDTVIARPEQGLSLQGESFLMFRAPGAKLAQLGNTLVVGRYGPAVSMLNHLPFEELLDEHGNPVLGIKILLEPTFTPVDSRNTKVSLLIQETKYEQRERFNGEMQFVYRPIVVVGDKTFGFTDDLLIREKPTDTIVTGPDGTRFLRSRFGLSFVAPTDFLRNAETVTVKDPFYGPNFSTNFSVFLGKDDFTAAELIPLTAGGKAQYAVRGKGFTKGSARVQVGTKDFCAAGCAGSLYIVNPSLMIIDAVPEDFKGVKNILVMQGDLSKGNVPSVVLPLPAPPDVPAPVIEKVADIVEGHVKTIALKGINLNSIEGVKFEGEELKAVPAPDGLSMTLMLSTALTLKAGDKEIHLHLKNGKVVPYVLTVKKS